MNGFELGLAGIPSTATPDVQLVETIALSPEQSKLLELLERGAHYLLQEGDHVPVIALVMRQDDEIQYIDLESGFARQIDALQATMMRLIQLAEARLIKAYGIGLQPWDSSGESLPSLAFDLEQAGHPRVLVSLTFKRDGGNVAFDPKAYAVVPPMIFPSEPTE